MEIIKSLDVEYLYWTDLNKNKPSKPALNNFAKELSTNTSLIDCNHIDPACVIDYSYPYSKQNANKYLIKKGKVQPSRREHYYGGIVQLAVNRYIGLGLYAPYIEYSCHNCDVLIVCMQKRKNASLGYSENDFKSHRILGFSTINLIRDNIIEIDIISSKHNHKGIGTMLMQTILDHAKKCELKYCILNAVPSAIGFYMKLGFIYLGHTISSVEKKGYMLFDLKEQNPRQKSLKHHQNRNSANLSEYINSRMLYGEPSVERSERESVSNKDIHTIEDINELIDALSTNILFQKTITQFKQQGKIHTGHYLPSSSFRIQNPLHALLRAPAPQLMMYSPNKTQKNMSPTMNPLMNPPNGLPRPHNSRGRRP
jgi:hypothetical protein